MAKVLGVCGAIGAGKGEVSTRLAEALDLPEFAYAQGLKQIVASIGIGTLPESRENKETTQSFQCTLKGIMDGVELVFPDFEQSRRVVLANQLFNLLQKNIGIQWVRQREGTHFSMITSYRSLYQLVGTDWARKLIHPDVWIQRRPLECVVNDVRAFKDAPNPYAEAQAIIADGGLVLRVIRDVDETDLTNGHESEHPMREDLIYMDVVNNGTLEDLDVTVDEIAEKLIEHFTPKPKVKDESPAKAKDAGKGKAPEKPKVSSSKDGDSE